jgi:GNAT superfamily N-acetyltransferase
MEIRPALKSDYEVFCKLMLELDQLYVTGQPQFFKLPVDPVRSTELFLEEIAPSFGGAFFAFEGATAIGFISFYVSETYDFPTVIKRKLLIVRNLVVAKNYKRKGVGKMLISIIKDWAENHKCHAVDLTVQSFNLEALEFYKSEGFSVQAWLMTLALS